MAAGGMTPQDSFLDYASLLDWAGSRREVYAAADPFPHIVHPSLLRTEALGAAIAAFPSPAELGDWIRADATDEAGRALQMLKLGYRDEFNLKPELRTLLHELNSVRFLRVLELLTGIRGLIPDPYLQGGGLHQYLPGAVLAVHADFSHHPLFKLDRRLNVLLYLNDEWSPAWGGELELWDRAMSRCVRTVPPVANTCVIFSTTRDSYHGMPNPLRCPADRTRKSIALYYYTNGRPENERTVPHSTLWQARPTGT